MDCVLKLPRNEIRPTRGTGLDPADLHSITQSIPPLCRSLSFENGFKRGPNACKCKPLTKKELNGKGQEKVAAKEHWVFDVSFRFYLFLELRIFIVCWNNNKIRCCIMLHISRSIFAFAYLVTKEGSCKGSTCSARTRSYLWYRTFSRRMLSSHGPAGTSSYETGAIGIASAPENSFPAPALREPHGC